MSFVSPETGLNTALEHRLFAAISIVKGGGIDQLLDQVVSVLESQNIKVAGCLQRETTENPGCCSTLYLENIASGEKSKISQSLGAGSRGCRLDPSALADLSKSLSNEIDENTDLLVLNRFGKGESEGQGFRIAIEKAIGLDIPVLTAVRGEYVGSWREFCGEFGVEIEPDKAEILNWCGSVLGSKFNAKLLSR